MEWFLVGPSIIAWVMMVTFVFLFRERKRTPSHTRGELWRLSIASVASFTAGILLTMGAVIDWVITTIIGFCLLSCVVIYALGVLAKSLLEEI